MGYLNRMQWSIDWGVDSMVVMREYSDRVSVILMPIGYHYCILEADLLRVVRTHHRYQAARR
jgi:hypothetical protein